MAVRKIWEAEAPDRADFLAAWTDVPYSYENLDGGGMTVNAAIVILDDKGQPMRAQARFGRGSLFGPGSGSGSWCTHQDIGGLGSSAALNVVAVGAQTVPEHQGNLTDEWRDHIAHEAFRRATEGMRIMGGKQDEYASVFGGINCFYFRPDGKVEVERLNVPQSMIDYLKAHLIIFDTDESRLSSRIHEEVWGNLPHSLPIMEEMIEIAIGGKEAMLKGDISSFAKSINSTCKCQFRLNPTIGSDRIVRALDALESERVSIAGKALGAGGGGALMAIAEEGEADNVKAIFKNFGFGRVLNWQFDFEGLRVWQANHPRMTG